MFEGSYKWQHDYVRLALDTGFNFERHKSEHFDRNKIASIDIERIIEERDIAAIESIIPSVTKFILDQEQAGILDVSFVKTFRLSQLALQYLLFCKKYLDNSLILVKTEIKKVKEENNELNLFVGDLKGHISTLMKEIDQKSTFKCSECNKIFSTEEFLSSHIKRRHSTQTEAETDKLQMEIKELKGRINTAEQKIQREQTEVDSKVKIEELQQKFEDLRVQVQSELKILQTQHSFQEKYENLFEKMALQGSKGGGDLGKRRESTTQTDLETDSKFEEKNKENIPELGNAQKFSEALETRVSTSLEKIESQMQSFWNKLNEMEMYKEKENFQKPTPVKPRSKFTIKNLAVDEIIEDKDEKKPTSNVEITVNKDSSPKKKPKLSEVKQTKIKEALIIEIQKTSSESESQTETEESPEEEFVKPKRPFPVPRKRLPSSVKKTVDDELFEHFKIEVEKVIMGRLQDLGVSPDWKGLPTRSFQRAVEIVNHQASLMKKNYSNFDFVSTQIEKNVSQKIEENRKPKSKKVKLKKKHSFSSSPKIEIKNRQMYDTDSESEPRAPILKENLYSAVIEELKTVTTKIDASDKSEEIGMKEDQTKGVLKSYPSVGSLTKKKVLFNLETGNKDGGSSTSITSSVFDGTTPREVEEPKKKEKDLEDLSDFDFSDI